MCRSTGDELCSQSRVCRTYMAVPRELDTLSPSLPRPALGPLAVVPLCGHPIDRPGSAWPPSAVPEVPRRLDSSSPRLQEEGVRVMGCVEEGGLLAAHRLVLLQEYLYCCSPRDPLAASKWLLVTRGRYGRGHRGRGSGGWCLGCDGGCPSCCCHHFPSTHRCSR